MTIPERAPQASAKHRGPPRHWRRRFFATLAESSDLAEALTVARVDIRHIIRLRRKDPGFARQFLVAMNTGFELLELNLLHRLRTGEARDPNNQKFDNATALRLLVAHRQHQSRQAELATEDGEDEILDAITAKLDAMRSNEDQAARLIADDETGEAG